MCLLADFWQGSFQATGRVSEQAELTSDCSCVGLKLWGLTVSGYEADRWCWWQDEGQTELLPSPQGVGTISGSEIGTKAGEPATYTWTCLLKIVLLSLVLPWCFATSCLDPKAPTKALWSVDGFQIIVAVGEYEWRASYIATLLTSVSKYIIISYNLSGLSLNINTYMYSTKNVNMFLPWVLFN